jgi:hypothetical protein
MMLKTSPAAFFKFGALMKAAKHREAVAVEPWFAAKLAGAMAEDCGPCTQLCVDMALEAGVPRDQIEAVLRRDLRAMNPDMALAFQFADAVVGRLASDDACRNAVRKRWGDRGVIDLAMALQMGRIFPMLKSALGYASECRCVRIEGDQVDVVKRVA